MERHASVEYICQELAKVYLEKRVIEDENEQLRAEIAKLKPQEGPSLVPPVPEVASSAD